VHHHTYLIREYLRSGKLKELDAYLEKYSASLPTTQYILYCQHYETNSLLGYFVQQAQEQGVAMDVFVQLPEHIALPETTLSVLLGNLLENAIDACKEVPADSGKEKTVTVRGRYDNGFVFFDISNTYSGTLRKTTAGEFLTTKKSGQGLGLGSVSHLVKYHNGVLEVDSTEDTFRVSVMLREQA
jgi:sensor histidine kinase regulating citrate/malate metabolism